MMAPLLWLFIPIMAAFHCPFRPRGENGLQGLPPLLNSVMLQYSLLVTLPLSGPCIKLSSNQKKKKEK